MSQFDNSECEAAKFVESCAAELVDRLCDFDISPRKVLNVGIVPESFARLLDRVRPDTAWVALADFPPDAQPEPERRVDLAVVNVPDAAHHDLVALFADCKRVLNDSGVLLAAVLGTGTFNGPTAEAPSSGVHDMRDLGDMLARQGYMNPVVDAERVAMSRESAADLIRQLADMGCLTLSESAVTHLSAPRHPVAEASGQQAQIEVIYAIAWNREQSTGSVRIGFTAPGDVAGFGPQAP